MSKLFKFSAICLQEDENFIQGNLYYVAKSFTDVNQILVIGHFKNGYMANFFHVDLCRQHLQITHDD
jgi:hypothetical protein